MTKHTFALFTISDLKSEKKVIIIIDYNINIVNSVIKFREINRICFYNRNLSDINFRSRASHQLLIVL